MPSIETNPAIFSARLTELFPHGVLAAELCGRGDPNALYPAEAAHLKRSVQKRAEEFAAGRLCARLLLHEFGISNFAIEVGAHRQPLWPEDLIGSITHTTGFCAAVAAPKKNLRSVGIDTEITGSVKTELWRGICTPLETTWLRSLPQSEQLAAATLIFSAKEAFYKCQFGLTQERLGFHDASVELPGWGQKRGAFRIFANRSIKLELNAALPLQGQYLFHEQFITSGIALLETR
jgi:enterobactin synthetase component D / holo-[acyl-carrier protein] synthase